MKTKRINPATPDWIKKARRNRLRQVNYYAKKFNLPRNIAEQILNERLEDAMQE